MGDWLRAQPGLVTGAVHVLLLLKDGPGGAPRTIGDFPVGNAPVAVPKIRAKDADLHDWDSWAVFTSVFVLLLAFDHLVLHRKAEVMSFKRAALCTLFWIACAVAFNGYVYLKFGADAALNWAVGYALEWMLSLDNLFVFHLVFEMYGVPDHLKHKPLFIGIIGAVIFRLVFFVVGQALLHSNSWMHLIFGGFLVYTGVKAGITDDEDEDPSQNPLVKWLERRLPLLGGYDKDGSFFVRVQLDTTGAMVPPPLASKFAELDETSALLQRASSPRSPNKCAPRSAFFREPSGLSRQTSPREAAPEDVEPLPDAPRGQVPVWDTSAGTSTGGRRELRATLLVLVVICLEITDIVFAVDSVTAILAQVPELFLAYTACTFASLGLRAMFFIIDELIRMFQWLRFAVAAILVFVGVKLIVSKMVYIPPGLVCVILAGTIAACMLLQVLLNRWRAETVCK